MFSSLSGPLKAFQNLRRFPFTTGHLIQVELLPVVWSIVIMLLTIPLLMSLRVGAWIQIALEILLFLVLIATIVYNKTPVMFDLPASGLAVICYCTARLRGSLGPPMITIQPRPRRTREAAKAA